MAQTSYSAAVRTARSPSNKFGPYSIEGTRAAPALSSHHEPAGAETDGAGVRRPAERSQTRITDKVAHRVLARLIRPPRLGSRCRAPSGSPQVLGPDRQRPDALAGGREDRVRH